MSYKAYHQKSGCLVPAFTVKPTVLVVDDQSAVLDVVAKILKHHSFQVLAAASPSDALRIGAEYSGDIHLLLSDITMAGMSGPDLAENLAESRPQMRVMFMSGYADGRLLLLDHGWQFIEKPFIPSTLVERVKRALRESPV